MSRFPLVLSTLYDLTLSRVVVILDKYHWMLYFLAPAMYPRFLITLDEELNNTPVTVRVGQVMHFVLPLVVLLAYIFVS